MLLWGSFYEGGPSRQQVLRVSNRDLLYYLKLRTELAGEMLCMRAALSCMSSIARLAVIEGVSVQVVCSLSRRCLLQVIYVIRPVIVEWCHFHQQK